MNWKPLMSKAEAEEYTIDSYYRGQDFYHGTSRKKAESIITKKKIGCPICKYYGFDGTCTAFPDRIPIMFLSGERGHTEPIKGQQNDIIFEWISPEEQQLRAKNILAKYDLDSQQDRLFQQEEAHI